MNSASLRIVGRSWSATLRHWVLAASASFWAKAVAMKAETTRRPLLPAWASALRMKRTRHLCQVAFSTLATAVFRPSWASEITSLTPRRPRRVSLRRKPVQKVSASDGPISIPRTSRRPSAFTPTAMMTATETTRPSRLAVDLFAQTRDLALGNAAHAERLDQVVDRAHRDALDVGLLDHGSERLLGHPARLEEAREVGALPQLRDAQFHRSGPRLPATVAVAVALDEPLGGLLAPAGAGQPLHLQLHQAMGGKADHLAQKVGVGGLLYQCAQRHHVVGHRSVLGSGRGFANPTLYRRSTMTGREAARSLRRYLRARFARGLLRRATPLPET